MIKFGRLSGAVFAAMLLLCAFPGATGSQEKTSPPKVVTEEYLERLRTDFDSFKSDFEQGLKEIEHKLDRIESLIDQQKYRPPSSEPDGRTGDSDWEWCCRHINHVAPCCRYVDLRHRCRS
jgi:hypothetical protein